MLMLDQCVSFQWEIGLREKDQLLSTFGHHADSSYISLSSFH